MSGCNYRELKIFQYLYAEEVQKVLKRATSRDLNVLFAGSTDFGAVEQVLGAEALWLEYKTRQCELEMFHWGAGTIVSTARPHCFMRYYVERIYFLRNLRL